LSTFEAASAHHRFKKDSVALRDVHNGIYKYNKQMPKILVANYDLGTLDDEMREPMMSSELKDYSIHSVGKKYFSSAIRDSIVSITSSGQLNRNQNKVQADMGKSQTRNFMNKGSADLFGSRLCNSMLSNRNSKHTIQQTDESNNKNNKLRASMLTPR